MTASATADIGTGATLTLGGAVGIIWDGIEILDASFSGASRESIDTTHLSTGTNDNTVSFGSRTFIGGRLSDPGELTVECNHNPDLKPPIDVAPATADSILLTYIGANGSAGATWTTTGFMTSYDVSGIGVDTKMTATAVFKLTGAVVIALQA